MQGVKTKGGLPQPYYMKPKQQGLLTTPMKKLLGYLFVLLVFGYIIYEVTPKPQTVDTEYELDKEQHDEEVLGQKLDKAGGEAGGSNVDKGIVGKGKDIPDIQGKKNIISGENLKPKLGDVDLEKAHEDTNHIIYN